jgi:mannosyltransferase
VGRPMGPVRLEGYTSHLKGFSHAPETPIAPGEVAHFTFYWSAPSPLPEDWPADALFTLRLNEQTVSAPLAGGGYPTGEWQAGELVRGEFDLLVDGPERRPILEVGGQTLRLRALP